MPKPIKICFILPDYDENNVSHFYHLYEFLEEVSKKLDIFLIVEKGNIGPAAAGYINKFYIQKFRFLPLRFLESFLIILKARRLGYKNFYTHYCYIGAINAGIVSRIFGGKSYYWNCAMNWLFKQRTLSGIGCKLALKLSHYLVTGGEIMKKGYAEHYNLALNKIKLLPNRINLKRFNISNISNKSRQSRDDQALSKNILFVHWLSKRKGADMIVPIAKNLKFKNLKFKIVGDGPYKKKLEEEIKENKLEKIIEVIGAVPNKDVVKYYTTADILILPSMEEGFPLTLLEAMAMGVPYVAFDVGSVREMSPEIAKRFLVKSGDIEKFIHKLEILLTDKKIYNQFKKQELEKVKEYSLEKIAKKFINLF